MYVASQDRIPPVLLCMDFRSIHKIVSSKKHLKTTYKIVKLLREDFQEEPVYNHRTDHDRGRHHKGEELRSRKLPDIPRHIILFQVKL